MARQKMDPELLNTCKQGLVENLKTLCETHLHDYEFFLACQVSTKRNMLHVIIKERPSFIKEALEILPIQVVRQLICLPNSTGDNPLHQAASRNNEETNAKLLVNAYKRSSDVVVGDDLPSCPPWRAENNQRKVPAQIAISCNHDEVAAFLISVDPDIFKFVDAGKLLLQSIFKGCLQTVNLILTSNYEYSIEGFDPRRIKNECHNFDERYVSLLQYHPEIANYLDHSGKKEVLARATNKGAVHVVKAILNIDISNSYSLLIGRGKNHLLGNAVSHDCLDIAHLILDAFNKSRECQVQKEMEAAVRSNSGRPAATLSLLSFQPLWSLPHKTGETPLSVAFRNRHKKLAVDMLYSDFALFSDLVDISDERPKMISASEQQDFIEDKNWIMDVYVEAFLQFLRKNSDDNKSRKLIRHLPNLIRFEDASGRQMLQYLLDKNDVDGMSLLLQIHPSIETPDGEHVQLFINAYRKGNLSAIRAICDLSPNCPQAAIKHEDQNTILHKVRLPGLQEYRSLLDIPGIAQLKKRTDASGRQPLIKAIQDNNVYLAEALLEMDGIDAMDIKSTDENTAAVLLKEKSKESHEWECLHKKYVKQATLYIQQETDLKELRNTQSVVAALLIAITFAAVFTVPGGFDQNNGDVLLGQRPSFIMFIIFDTYAMCTSMIVLFTLIWSMLVDNEEARLLIDRNVILVLQSLYGTVMAFMAAVYTMLSHKTLWLAVVVCFTSSCVLILVNPRLVMSARTSRPQGRLVEPSIAPASSAETSMGPRMSGVLVQR